MVQNWQTHIDSLISHYENRKHPLDYKSLYQLVVMVILSAQDSDKHINELAPAFFEAYPSINALAKARIEDLHPYFSTVRNFGHKCEWLVKMAQNVCSDELIPTNMTELTRLPGIGRKSANVIIRESGNAPEGIIVDLHVVRVAPRIGIATGNHPEKIEKQLMSKFSQKSWNEVGMALSFLGREICRPTRPQCHVCLVNTICNHYNGTVTDKIENGLFLF